MTTKAQLNAITEIILSLGGRKRTHIDLIKFVDELIEAIEVNAWVSIDSAPKDREILVGWESEGVEHMAVAWWNDKFEYIDTDEHRGAWTDGVVQSFAHEEVRELHPTKWRELPASWKRP